MKAFRSVWFLVPIFSFQFFITMCGCCCYCCCFFCFLPSFPFVSASQIWSFEHKIPVLTSVKFNKFIFGCLLKFNSMYACAIESNEFQGKKLVWWTIRKFNDFCRSLAQKKQNVYKKSSQFAKQHWFTLPFFLFFVSSIVSVMISLLIIHHTCTTTFSLQRSKKMLSSRFFYQFEAPLLEAVERTLVEHANGLTIFSTS